MKPTDAITSARMPASAPKPTAFTKMIATITGWKVRQSAITARAGQFTQAGIRLRAARKPIGSDSRMPPTEASTAISRLSFSPLSTASQREKSGGNMRSKKRAACSSPVTKRAQVKSSSDAAYTT